jgi:hypothetical protein
VWAGGWVGVFFCIKLLLFGSCGGSLADFCAVSCALHAQFYQLSPVSQASRVVQQKTPRVVQLTGS